MNPVRTIGAAPALGHHGARRAWSLDLLALLALLGLAWAARYPYLWVVPRFRDETFNALRALDIYRGKLVALTDVELYMGSFYNYVVAAAFYPFGPTIYLARLVVALFGVATVGCAYMLGREVGGRRQGVLAAALLLTNAVHIAAMGHVGFSANIAPFFTTLGFWLLHRAVVRKSGRTLVAAGFAWGMALHTHPISIGFLPGAGLWLLWKGGHFFKTRWLYAAILLFLVAYAPMIAFNIQTGGESLRHALYTANERPDYARNRPTQLTPSVYLSRQMDYWDMAYHTLGGALDRRGLFGVSVVDPSLVLIAALSTVGLFWAARRGYALPLLVVVTFSVILPVFNAAHYDVIGDGRYFAPALPLIYTAVALTLSDVAMALRRRLPAGSSLKLPELAIAAVALLLVVAPLAPLARYYQRFADAEPTNASLIRAVERIEAVRNHDEVVILDDNLNDRKVANSSPWDEASIFRVLRFIMEFKDIPYQIVDLDDDALAALARNGSSSIAVIAAGRDSVDTNRLGRALQQHGVQALDGGPARPPRPAERFGIYRVGVTSAGQAHT